MSPPTHPRLRSALGWATAKAEDGSDLWVLTDAEGIATKQIAVRPAFGVLLAHLLDGTRTPEEVERDWAQAVGQPPPPGQVASILAVLDEATLLEGEPAWAARAGARETYRREGYRHAICAGSSYAATAEDLRTDLARWRRESGVEPVHGPVTAVLAPHIDPRGGAACHGAAAAAIARSPADVFVILGTAHASLERPFALTSLDFETPSGRVRTNTDLVEALALRAGGGLLDEEHKHGTEHSVEFQAAWIRAIHADRKDLSIVPVLVGSIHRHLVGDTLPQEDGRLRDFVEALRELGRELGERIALVASVDFAHVGPAYGDETAPDDVRLSAVMRGDRRLLEAVTAVDPDAWIRGLQAEKNERNVCGAAPTWVLLSALEGEALEARFLRHDLWEIDPTTHSYVSFAAAAFRSITRSESAGSLA